MSPPPRILLGKFITITAFILILALATVSCGGSPGGDDGTDTKTGSTGNWTAVDASGIFGTDYPSGIVAIAYGGGKFVAGGARGKMATSTDGVTWTAVPNSTFGTGSADQIEAIAHNGSNRFVAVGDKKIAYSADGVTWDTVADSKLGSIFIQAIAYGNGKFVAGNFGGEIAYSSDNGVNWTAVVSSPFRPGGSTYSIYAIAYGGDKFVAGGESGKMAYSTDGGVTWAAVGDSKLTSNITAIAYGSNKFVAINSIGDMAASPDGVNWTPVTTTAFVYQNKWGATEQDTISAIAYGGGKFAAGGINGTIATSTDGVNWTVVGDKILGTEGGDGYLSKQSPMAEASLSPEAVMAK
jgi:hypothetical protein